MVTGKSIFFFWIEYFVKVIKLRRPCQTAKFRKMHFSAL